MGKMTQPSTGGGRERVHGAPPSPTTVPANGNPTGSSNSQLTGPAEVRGTPPASHARRPQSNIILPDAETETDTTSGNGNGTNGRHGPVELSPRDQLRNLAPQLITSGSELSATQRAVLAVASSDKSDAEVAKMLRIPTERLDEAMRLTLGAVRKNGANGHTDATPATSPASQAETPEETAIKTKEAAMVASATTNGNRHFPQSFLAPGIEGAKTMADLAEKDGRNLSAVIADPPPEDVVDRVGRARDNAHEKSGFHTPVAPRAQDAQALTRVWNDGNNSSINQLSAFARLTHSVRQPTVAPPPLPQLLDAVQNDPLFRGLLNTASEAIASKPVQDLATTFKGEIGAFMRKYAEDIDTNHLRDPDRYAKDQSRLMDSLKGTLDSAISLIQARLTAYVVQGYPQEAALRERIATINPADLFGSVTIRSIDPMEGQEED